MVVRWCPYGDRTPPNVVGAAGWTPRRLAKFVEDVNALTGLDGAAVLVRAVEIGLAVTVESANGWQRAAEYRPARLAEGIMGASSPEALALWVGWQEFGEAVRPVAPDTPEARRAGGAWVEAVGAFKVRDAVDWDGHPAAHLVAPECPHVPAGWSEFGSFVPWMVAAGYSPQNAPRRMVQGGVLGAVRLVEDAVAGWDAGAVDEAAQWWSDDWYRGVGIGPESAALFRGVGWEPPLAAFMTRWGGRVQAKTLVSRFRDVPVPFLRRVWREGLRGVDMGPGYVQAAKQSALTDLVGSLGVAVAEVWVDRFGSVASAARLARWGLTPEVLARVDAAWPGHDLFRFVESIPDRGEGMLASGGWLDVALATGSPDEVLHPDAHIGAVSLLPGWVGDFFAAGVDDPDEAMGMVESGVDRDTLRMMGALRGQA